MESSWNWCTYGIFFVFLIGCKVMKFTQKTSESWFLLKDVWKETFPHFIEISKNEKVFFIFLFVTCRSSVWVFTLIFFIKWSISTWHFFKAFMCLNRTIKAFMFPKYVLFPVFTLLNLAVKAFYVLIFLPRLYVLMFEQQRLYVLLDTVLIKMSV